MPLISSSYNPPLWLRNGHIQTCWPVLFRDMPPLPCERHRVATSDSDFLDLDLHKTAKENNRFAAIISHGLEGNSHRKYITGMVKMCLSIGVDAIAWNMRGCSGEPNATDRMYHMGQTEDVATIAKWAIARGYTDIALIGFSMGGNQILRWLGTAEPEIPKEIRTAYVVSVPCHLTDAAKVLDTPACSIYMRYFMRTMHKKVREKAQRFSPYPSIENLEKIRTFYQFDSRFTAPLYGFSSAEHYWASCGAVNVLKDIKLPVCMLMAKDDPFCTPSCFPIDTAQHSTSFHLELVEHGGHVGFVIPGRSARYYSEKRAEEFLRKYLINR